MTSYRIIPLDRTRDDFGVYADKGTGVYGTPMVYRGTMDECRKWIRRKG